MEYRFVYEELQMTLIDVSIGGRLHGVKIFTRMLLLWIVLPSVLIGLALWKSLRYCYRWYRAFKLQSYLVEDEEPNPQV